MTDLLRTNSLTLVKNNQILFESLNWRIKPGEFWGVVGLNGRGKTSLMYTIAGLQKPTAGTIHIKNEPLLNLSRKQIAQHIGLLLQEEHYPLPIRVKDVIQSGLYPHLKVHRDFSHYFPLLETFNLVHLLPRNILTLSGGEKRRVSIARILLQSPLIYLLDEPCNHLDLLYQKLILQHFKTLSQNSSVAVVMSSHDIHTLKHYCDFILLFLPNGKILTGKTQDLLKEPLDNLLASLHS